MYDALTPNREGGSRGPKQGMQMSEQQLLDEYAPLVKHVAGRIAIFLPSHIQMEDLLSDGTLGLLDALEKFNPSKNVQFRTYATLRIRGAILDGLRNLDWVPRSVRRTARAVEQQTAALTQSLGRSPTRQELASSLHLGLSELDEALSQASGSYLTSLDDVKKMTENSELLLGETIRDDTHDTVTEVERRQRSAMLRQAIDNLSERERTVLHLYHYEGLTCKEVAQVLGVSEPRVSQLHGRGLAKLRARLAGQQDFLTAP
jgi:RNA polymerase sigma factor FliA